MIFTNTDDGVTNSLASASGGSGRPKTARLSVSAYPIPGRSPEVDRPIAFTKAPGMRLSLAVWERNCIPFPSSLVMGMKVAADQSHISVSSTKSRRTSRFEIVDLCLRVERLMPELGENRIEGAEFFQRATTLCIELVAGSVAETIFYPNEESRPTSHDEIEAAAFAAIAVESPRAVALFLEYCRAEAEGLIRDHRNTAEAIADAIVEYGELNGAMVDQIISSSVARQPVQIAAQRKLDWARTCITAKDFKRDAVIW